MSPVTHLLISWVTANTDSRLDRRERTTITLAGMVPDLDGLGFIAEQLTTHWAHPLYWYSKYHHVLTHNLGTAIAVAIVSFLVATRRWITTALALIAFHLHILGDVAGARGPGGEQWPISYLLPFSGAWEWVWDGAWELNTWPNFTITATVLAVTFYLAWKRGYSPLEMVSGSADKAFVTTLRHRVPHRDAAGESE